MTTFNACVKSHLELVRCAPRTAAVRKLLRAHPYNGDSSGAMDVGSDGAGAAPDERPTMEELERLGQCSRAELRAELMNLHAIEIDGRWCTLDDFFEADVRQLSTPRTFSMLRALCFSSTRRLFRINSRGKVKVSPFFFSLTRQFLAFTTIHHASLSFEFDSQRSHPQHLRRARMAS